MRTKPQSYLNLLLIFTTIFMSLVALHLFQKDQKRQEKDREIRPEIIETKTFENLPVHTETNTKSKKNIDPLVSYSTDEHLRSLLRKQANSLKQVTVTIIGGDSYSLFTWDWHERMLEISNTTDNCNCFVIAMDDIALIFAIQQKVPVYYSTFTFQQQMQWINVIESRQHSLYRVGYAKFAITAKIIEMGYSVMLSEMDVFWQHNPLDYLRNASSDYDLQISHHYGSHPRVNIGLFYVQSTPTAIEFFNHIAQFWLRYGKGGYLSDQRVLDALLNNYDRLDSTYLRAMKPLTPLKLKWTTHDFGNHFSHMMTDGSAFILFQQAARFGKRSKKFHGTQQSKFFTVMINNGSFSNNEKNLIVRSLLIIQQTQLKDRILILPAFAANITVTPITSQFDIKKFLIYWKEDRVRLPEFLLWDKSKLIPNKTLPFESGKTYDDINGILIFPLETIPLNSPPPTAQFEVQIRDSLYWCSPPHQGGGWCIHHPRDYGATMELLFSCRGDPYPPCANKTDGNEQFLKRPYEKS